MPVTVPSNRVDPTGTATLRRNYAARLRGRFDELATAIRRGVADNDSLGLNVDVLQSTPTPPPRFPFATDERKRRAFMDWLERQERRGVLEVIGDDSNPFIRQAYSRAVQDADRALNAEGVSVPTQDLEAVFNTPVHRRTLEQLYTRNFENLKDITRVMNRQISEELTDGFSRGLNPNDMARNITDRVDKIGRHRATVLARTETIHAYSESTLNRYEQMGITNVTVRAEFLTAGDDRVCPLCSTLEGTTVSTEVARTGTWEFTADIDAHAHLEGEYPFNPPVHPACRCRWLPST